MVLIFPVEFTNSKQVIEIQYNNVVLACVFRTGLNMDLEEINLSTTKLNYS